MRRSLGLILGLLVLLAAGAIGFQSAIEWSVEWEKARRIEGDQERVRTAPIPDNPPTRNSDTSISFGVCSNVPETLYVVRDSDGVQLDTLLYDSGAHEFVGATYTLAAPSVPWELRETGTSNADTGTPDCGTANVYGAFTLGEGDLNLQKSPAADDLARESGENRRRSRKTGECRCSNGVVVVRQRRRSRRCWRESLESWAKPAAAETLGITRGVEPCCVACRARFAQGCW